jgi:hypothetical protein
VSLAPITAALVRQIAVASMELDPLVPAASSEAMIVLERELRDACAEPHECSIVRVELLADLRGRSARSLQARSSGGSLRAGGGSRDRQYTTHLSLPASIIRNLSAHLTQTAHVGRRLATTAPRQANTGRVTH